MLHATQGGETRAASRRSYAFGARLCGEASRTTALSSVVFPPLGIEGAAARRGIASTVLLRLCDGSLRMLRLASGATDRAALECIAGELVALPDDVPTEPALRRLAGELGVPALIALNVPLDRVDPAAWDVTRAAVAATAHAFASASEGATVDAARTKAIAIERHLSAWLDEALAAFVATLDPEACAVARELGRFDIDTYNFLVRGARPAWRRQFARTYPLLVATAAATATGAFLREAIDAGAPLVKRLAERWAVSPGALRCLQGRSIAHIGAQWQHAPHRLARMLDALRAEDRPGDDPHAWQRLAEAAAIAEEVFRRPAASCALTLGWLRTMARRGFEGVAREAVPAAPVAAIAQIDALRAALVDDLAQVARTGNRRPEAARTLAAAIADRHLAALPLARLTPVARRFAQLHAVHRAAAADAASAGSGPTFWPLLPAALLSADGTRRVLPLTTLAELRSEGAAQSLCIAAGAELVNLAASCAGGDRYVVSIRHAPTGVRLSTAEVHVVRRLTIGEPRPRIYQHKARGNRRPSAACAQALREALSWVASREGQAHLDEGRRHAVGHHSAEAAADRAQQQAVREALQQALGEPVYRRLMSEVSGGAAAEARNEEART